MDVIIQTVFCADAEARCCRITDTIGGLVEELDAELQRRRDLSRHSAPVDAEIMRAPRGTDLTAAASEGRPFSPVLLHPDRQQNRRLASDRRPIGSHLAERRAETLRHRVRTYPGEEPGTSQRARYC